MSSILFPAGLVLLLLALIVLLLLLNERRAHRQRLLTEHRRALGLPEGELVYEDADGLGETLHSSAYPLTGKPDYIVKLADRRLVPIELKPNVQNVTAPYPNHEVQVAAYCLILEDYSESLPTHGILRYADCEFTIEYTPALKKKVLRILADMERCTEKQPPPLMKQKAAKCRACAFQPICRVGRGK